jgi:hypothetical protein
MTMNDTTKVLQHLQRGGDYTSSDLAMLLAVPEPSIRRSIRQLRLDGWNISFGPRYRLGLGDRRCH